MKSVFVFGTNPQGFHGAGAAGYAMFGIHGNVWRTAIIPGTGYTLVNAPNGTKGLRAVKGQSSRLMEGSKGLGYGIVTVTKTGAVRSATLTSIKYQLEALKAFATINEEYLFHLSNVGCGYAGYPIRVMNDIHESLRYPSNIIRTDNFNINTEDI